MKTLYGEFLQCIILEHVYDHMEGTGAEKKRTMELISFKLRFTSHGTYLGVYGEWPWRWVAKDENDDDFPTTEEQATGVQIGNFYVRSII